MVECCRANDTKKEAIEGERVGCEAEENSCVFVEVDRECRIDKGAKLQCLQIG
jgi:hypothetical protein